jgi:hypothetical protein
MTALFEWSDRHGFVVARDTLLELLTAHDRADRTCDVLRPVYDSFTEGHGTPVLSAAAARLARFGGAP